MGMKQSRCSCCRKRRRKVEGWQRTFGAAREDGWQRATFDGQEALVCWWCIKSGRAQPVQGNDQGSD